jgi:hypothetical protein
MDLGVGSIVWVFDKNRRVYRTPEPGRLWSSQGPIYREHFRPIKIANETRVSWVLANGNKVNKKTLAGIYTSEAQIDDHCWVHDYLRSIVRIVERCNNAVILRKIADLVDWHP